jgi:hypothetical protein
MSNPLDRRGRPIDVPGAERLARALGLRRGQRPGRPRPQVYGEDEVRAMIYGRHSGTVEPPQPADSATLAAAVKEGSQERVAEDSLAIDEEPRPGAGHRDGGEQ